MATTALISNDLFEDLDEYNNTKCAWRTWINWWSTTLCPQETDRSNVIIMLIYKYKVIIISSNYYHVEMFKVTWLCMLVQYTAKISFPVNFTMKKNDIKLELDSVSVCYHLWSLFLVNWVCSLLVKLTTCLPLSRVNWMTCESMNKHHWKNTTVKQVEICLYSQVIEWFLYGCEKLFSREFMSFFIYQQFERIK